MTASVRLVAISRKRHPRWAPFYFLLKSTISQMLYIRLVPPTTKRLAQVNFTGKRVSETIVATKIARISYTFHPYMPVQCFSIPFISKVFINAVKDRNHSFVNVFIKKVSFYKMLGAENTRICPSVCFLRRTRLSFVHPTKPYRQSLHLS